MMKKIFYFKFIDNVCMTLCLATLCLALATHAHIYLDAYCLPRSAFSKVKLFNKLSWKVETKLLSEPQWRGHVMKYLHVPFTHFLASREDEKVWGGVKDILMCSCSNLKFNLFNLPHLCAGAVNSSKLTWLCQGNYYGRLDGKLDLLWCNILH